MDTLEGNKLIADFMGATVTQPYSENKDYEQDGVLFYYPDRSSPSVFKNMSSASVKYHSSWDWLMPVVEKIEVMGISVEIDGNWCAVQVGQNVPQTAGSAESKIKATWMAIVNFIQWHNETFNPLKTNTQ